MTRSNCRQKSILRFYPRILVCALPHFEQTFVSEPQATCDLWKIRMRMDQSIRLFDAFFSHFNRVSCPLFAMYKDHAARSWARFATSCSQQTTTYILDTSRISSDYSISPHSHQPWRDAHHGGTLTMEDPMDAQRRDAPIGVSAPTMLPLGGIMGIPRRRVVSAMIGPCQRTSLLMVSCLGQSENKPLQLQGRSFIGGSFSHESGFVPALFVVGHQAHG